MATRRGFLAGLAALALPCPSWADVGAPAFLAAAKAGEDYLLHGLNETGDSLFSLSLPARGHAAAAHPSRPLAVAFARRPGTYAVVIDCRTGTETARLTPPEGRQFNGHGVFSADGATLYTSEVIADGSEGRIGLWETSSFRRIGEWASGGIGPHDMKRLGDRLVVANGGIATDPKDRSKLNIDSMRPNLSLIGPDGGLVEQAELETGLHQNSIRHLALDPAGEVAFAMQWEGDAANPVPLLGLWTPGAPPVLCPAPEAEALRMKGYAGSIAWSGDEIALTSPKGGVAMIFASTGAHLATVERPDICGVAVLAGGGFLASDGAGGLSGLSSKGLVRLSQQALSWDNHLVALG
ncbi:DUF1513 domain-containing protein [Tabrizicola oligotrophica]|uniref:DUF1513 domain-containing protein n=1 Tax=Tabrizicola oligotrophica TaxID=2710650 RepID=A0A6M0QST8_9RHOB|nr:DUF1513 domain-containing protein [Tabrizicola oligotrophica]NEY90530.1 DUF1513 domain-containing protein [Tabrizicola oligotrophica]